MHTSSDDEHSAFSDALARLVTARRGDDLCGPFLGAVGVSGVSISTLGRPLGSETVCASSAVAARIDEIQIDFGEGPCWEALRRRRPVLEPHFPTAVSDAWPTAGAALRALDIGALFAFPLFVGDLDVGSVDLYCDEPRVLSGRAVGEVTALAGAASRHLLRNALDDLDDAEEGIADGPHSRREMHQASGMIAAQLGIGVDDALLVLRGRAFSSGRSVAEVAADVVARRVAFDR